MAITSATDLLAGIRAGHLLEPAQWEETAGPLQRQHPEPRALARELVQRGWLTPYQVNQLFLDHGQPLLLGSYVLLEKLGEGGFGARKLATANGNGTVYFFCLAEGPRNH